MMFFFGWKLWRSANQTKNSHLKFMNIKMPFHPIFACSWNCKHFHCSFCPPFESTEFEKGYVMNLIDEAKDKVIEPRVLSKIVRISGDKGCKMSRHKWNRSVECSVINTSSLCISFALTINWIVYYSFQAISIEIQLDKMRYDVYMNIVRMTKIPNKCCLFHLSPFWF